MQSLSTYHSWNLLVSNDRRSVHGFPFPRPWAPSTLSAIMHANVWNVIRIRHWRRELRFMFHCKIWHCPSHNSRLKCLLQIFLVFCQVFVVGSRSFLLLHILVRVQDFMLHLLFFVVGSTSVATLQVLARVLYLI